MAPMTSFIRWAGGKSWLVPYVQKLVEKLDYNNYYEPFMGGASIFFSLNNPNKSILSDVNEELVNMFICVRDNPNRVISYLDKYNSDEESYYKIRDNEPKARYESAARFLYLNVNSFNGLYRVNRQGKFNVPYGKRNALVDCKKLKEVSQKLTNVDILCRDFDSCKDDVKKGDLLFLDPPYAVSKDKNGFIQYNANLFSLEDQYRLKNFIDYINDKGAYFILTNAANDKIVEIFSDCGRMEKMERNSLIGGKNSYRGKIQEYIFTNIPEVNNNVRN